MLKKLLNVISGCARKAPLPLGRRSQAGAPPRDQETDGVPAGRTARKDASRIFSLPKVFSCEVLPLASLKKEGMWGIRARSRFGLAQTLPAAPSLAPKIHIAVLTHLSTCWVPTHPLSPSTFLKVTEHRLLSFPPQSEPTATQRG